MRNHTLTQLLAVAGAFMVITAGMAASEAAQGEPA
jgi:hypothetical protein